ncbi:hypothetical protein PV328_005153 [Microctonus aethiopoides]|uniref:Gamma-tubulin complex component n=1 Tax=Microctonus aethiopoides TaxID=144406 RepID=A0AA39KS04_9HYME|nr:hypothetical protein PV328_005153 [Microctonus aethiopoides]
MGTQILNDIDKDLKLLITAITGFEQSDEGFRTCERFVFSNIKHHRYLSINAHDTRKAIEDIKKKLTIYGKYTVANEFSNLVDTFLTSFVFDQHPQYDLQWSLLCLLLNLSSETDKSTVEFLHTTRIDKTLNNAIISESNEVNEIDWGEYLKDGQEDFFCDYGESSESEWSDCDDEPNADNEIDKETKKSQPNNTAIADLDPIGITDQSEPVDLLTQAVESRKWLDLNIENSWWNSISQHECKVSSKSSHAHLCQLYNKEVLNNPQVIATITEYQACREVLWMFHIPTKMVVYDEITPNKFSVLPNLSIPSLTAPAFNNAFSNFCKYFSMIRTLDTFEEKLWIMDNSDTLPPLTYTTYNVAMKQYLIDIKQNIVKIESKAMRQNEITTFCTLSRDLENCMSRIQMLYKIHQSVIDSDISLSNWKKTYKLLYGLYNEMENSPSCTRTNLCASLYLSSLRVYLNIIDTWLSEGRLEDFRDEFLINKIVEKSKHEDEPIMNKFKIRFVDDDDEFHDPIMKKLIRKVRDMGRSIELLVTMDRISELWKSNAEQNTSQLSLNDEFIAEVIAELSKYGKNCVDELDANEEFAQDGNESMIDSETSSPNSIFSDVEANIRKQVLRINNPFLMKVFQDYLPSMGIAAVDAVDSNSKNNEEICDNWGINIFHKLEKISPFILPYREVLERVLEKILDRRYSCASKLVKDILIDEYKLGQHLKLMRSIYMMERGHIMKKFYQHMFQAIENNSCWMNPYNLTSILEEVLSDEWRDSTSHNHWTISVEDNGIRQVLQTVDRTNLYYSIGWPINMVLNDEVLAKYNAIFRFQLKLKWALWSLNNLRFVDLEGKDPNNMKDLIYHFYARRLESLRFWLLHAIGSIHTYLSGQVLQSLGSLFEKSLDHANNLDDIVEIHNNYLDKVHEHCLQTPQFTDVMVTINNLLGMCAHIRDRWNRGVKQLIPSELDLMESSYTKYHTYLALALHNAVQHKEADYCKSVTSLQHLRYEFLNIPQFLDFE